MRALEPERVFEKAERKRAASKFIDAIPLYLKVKAQAKGDRELTLDCLFALGDTFRMVGEFKRAAACYRQAARGALAMDDRSRVLDAEVGLGLSLRATSDYRSALHLFNGALKGYAALKD